MQKSKIIYISIAAFIAVFALVIRKLWVYLPYWINVWIGDFLWSAMLYLLMVAFLAPKNVWRASLYLIVFCWLIEISQMWHTPWLDAFRSTFIGWVLLGHGFLWSDIFAYTAGVLVAYFMDQKRLFVK